MRQDRYISGFSLVEVAIILVVISVVGGLTLGLAPSNANREAERITQRNLENIEAAIYAFYNQNGRLPCPATFNGTGGAFATETDCSITTPVTGTFQIDSDPNRMRMGSVPGKALDLSPSILVDGWDNRIIYAVPTELAINTTRYDGYTNTGNAINVLDTNGNTVEDGNVSFVLFAPGQNRKGAFTARGSSSTVAINLCNGSGNDLENCDSDDTFRKSFLDLSSATYYDDFFLYSTLDKVAEYGNYAQGGAGNVDNFYSLFREEASSGNEPANTSIFEVVSFSNTASNNANITATTTGTVPDQSTSFGIPAGKYLVRAHVQTCGTDRNYSYFYTGATFEGGIPNDSFSGEVPTYCGRTVTLAYFDFSAATTYRDLGNYKETNNTTDGHGRDPGSGYPYSFREIEFWRLD